MKNKTLTLISVVVAIALTGCNRCEKGAVCGDGNKNNHVNSVASDQPKSTAPQATRSVMPTGSVEGAAAYPVRSIDLDVSAGRMNFDFDENGLLKAKSNGGDFTFVRTSESPYRNVNAEFMIATHGNGAGILALRGMVRARRG
ncbi:hypothetical protein N7U49_47535 [Streptomyces sp. AD2-2]|nr:hypothetical protein N7U49_47535 [Streptomyces sp. AD2-2]